MPFEIISSLTPFLNTALGQLWNPIQESLFSEISFYIKTPNYSHWIEFPYRKNYKQEYVNLDYPFPRKYSQYFCLDSSGAFEDPVFDITLINKTQNPIIINKLGIKIIKSLFFEAPLGGYDAVKVNRKEKYVIKIPNLGIEYDNIMNSRKVPLYDQSRHLIPKRIVHFNRDFFHELSDPYLIPPNRGFFRFDLRLNNYEKHLPNFNIVQFYVQTESRKFMSKRIELVTLTS